MKKPTLQEALAQVKTAMAAKPQRSSDAVSTVDWPAMMTECTPDRISALAIDRGLPESIFTQLHLAGMLGWDDGPAFPLHLDGVVIGAHIKTSQGWRWNKPKDSGMNPLVLGDLSQAGYAVICESQWDAIAMASTLGGLDCGASFIITRGAANGNTLKQVKIPKEAKVILVPQNDAPKANGDIPSEMWYSQVKEALEGRVIYRAKVPAEFEDANDWVSAGATNQEVTGSILQAKNETISAMRVRPITDFFSQPIDHSATLLGDRYLCREGSGLFIGPSGVGKSSASVQQDILWGMGQAAFGIAAARPLKILTIQAENDDGDMTEMVKGVMDGLNLDERHRAFLRQQVFYATVKTKTGRDFFSEVLTPLLDYYRPDLVRIDPFQSFLGDDFKEAKSLIDFCQGGLNPLLEQYKCGCMLNHHTPKTTNRDTTNWRATDWMYAGAGSAQLTNWARSILVVDSTSVAGVFKFIAAKRGSRIGWDHEMERYFAHSKEPGRIHWVEAEAMEILEAKEPVKKRKAKEESDDKNTAALRCLDGVSCSAKGWELKAKLPRATFFRMLKDFQARDWIKKSDEGFWSLTDAGKEAIS